MSKPTGTGSPSHVTDAIPAYALGALRGDELRQVEEHLAHCAFCQEELEAYREVVALLPLAVPEAQPPARLRASVLNAAAHSTVTASPRPTFWQGVQRFWQKAAPVWGIASLVLVLALLATNLLLWRAWQSERQSGVELNQFQVVALGSAGPAENAEGLLIISPEGRYGTLVVNNLPPLGEEQQYQLWLIEGEERTSGGVFSVRQNGYGALVVYSEEPLAGYDRVGITIEPYGGSPGPTGERVLGGSL